MILFTNPGELDLRLVSTFGINVKPNSTNPVGYFGTGLKYALAVLARENCDVTIHIGEDTYQVAKTTDNVRGKNVDFLSLYSGKGDNLPLPFTTDLGRNWKLWMAYRELYYNTMDERGEVESHPGYWGPISDNRENQSGQTVVCVTDREGRFDDIHNNRDEFLLLSQPLYSTPELEIHPGAGTAIFYRGIKVCDLDKPTVLRYNFLRSMDLTEDRTLALPYMVPHYLKYWIAGNLHDRDLLERILTAHKGTFEHDSLDYGRDMGPSQEFLEVAGMHLGDVRGNSSARQVAKSFLEPPPKRVTTDLNPVQQAQLDAVLEHCCQLGIHLDSHEIVNVEYIIDGIGDLWVCPEDFQDTPKDLAKVLIRRWLGLEIGEKPDRRESFLLDRLLALGDEMTGEVL